MNGANGVMVLGQWDLVFTVSGVFILQCVLHEAGREWNSEAQPEAAAAARGRRREHPVVLPSVASGSHLV